MKSAEAWPLIVGDMERFWSIGPDGITEMPRSEFMAKLQYLGSVEQSAWSNYMRYRDKEDEGMPKGEVIGNDAAVAAYKKVKKAKNNKELETQMQHIGTVLKSMSVELPEAES